MTNPDERSFHAPWPAPVQPGLRGEGVLLLTHRDPDAAVQGPSQLHQLVPPDSQLLSGKQDNGSVSPWGGWLQFDPLHSEEVM